VSAERAWYDAAFERGYLDVYPQRDLAAADREVEALLAQGVGGRVLDLGCGFGRHQLALRRRGVQAFGLDRSPELLAHGGSIDPDGLTEGRRVRGDFRCLPIQSGSFEHVLMLFSSFGYFDDAGNARVLDELARVLAPEGIAVLDLLNPDHVRATLVPESTRELAGRRIVERRRLDAHWTRIVKDVQLREGDGSSRSWTEDVRLYGPAELAAWAAPRGLELARAAGSIEGAAYEARSPRLVAWLRREGASR
jgi:SAM-dependent methyltransferase